RWSSTWRRQLPFRAARRDFVGCRSPISSASVFGTPAEVSPRPTMSICAPSGDTREDLVAGRVNFRTMTPPEDTDADTRVLQRLAAEEQVPPWEKELLRKDGSRVAVVVGVARLKDSSDQGIVFQLDISERKRAEEDQRTLLGELQASAAEVKVL